MNEINKEERMQGLSGQQVSESKAKYGTNELAKKETESLWSMFSYPGCAGNLCPCIIRRK